MKPDELFEAADRIVKAVEDFPGDEWYSQKTATAADELATHIQRMYDPTPIDEAWLRPLCERVSDLGSYWTICERDRVYIVLIRWSGGFHLKCGEVSVTESATRGDVRRLCELMGIELRETNP